MRVFGASVIPAICAAIIAYFGYYTISGTRGYHAYDTVSSELAAQQQKLASLHGERMRLEHRIDLLESGHVDRDMVEEVEREELLGSTPGQIAVPRERH
ncbi:MAG TPA: septum formation initiator family protein [Rhizomicrobium sp.]|jgi:cell division protein FtsB